MFLLPWTWSHDQFLSHAQQEVVKLKGALKASGDLMCHPEPCILKAPEPYVPAPVPESVHLKPKTPKIKNLPTQVENQKERKLVNDQQLLEQLWLKLNIHSIQFEPDPNPEFDPALNLEPEPVLNPDPKPSALNNASNGAESMISAPLLFLLAKIKFTEVHFMVDSGAMNNFLSHNLVWRLNVPTNKLKSPICISFANGHMQLIQQYCLVQIPFDPQYQPLLKFYVANITHDAYLGQPWLTSDGIMIKWTSGNVCIKSDITIVMN
jgi:hypothetical protein